MHDWPHFYLTTNFNMKIFVHERGMELWLKGFAVFPFEVPSIIIETNNSRGMAGAMMALKQVDSTYLNKEEEPCRHYSVDSFISCCKSKLWDNLRSSINCTIAELKNIIPNKETLTECKNETIAHNIYWNSAYSINSFTHKPWLFGCPVPCKQLTYKILIEHYHKNNYMLDGNMMQESKHYYTLMVNNPSATVEEQIESLEYDLVDLLASAGGNLGLLLGFSCLSVLFSAINFATTVVSKNCNKFKFY